MGAEVTDPRELARQRALEQMKQQGIFEHPTIASGPGGAPETLERPPATPEEDGWGPPEEDGWGPPEGPPAATLSPGRVQQHAQPAAPSQEATVGAPGEVALTPELRRSIAARRGELGAVGDAFMGQVSNGLRAAGDALPLTLFVAPHSNIPGGIRHWNDPENEARAHMEASSARAHEEHPVMAAGGDLAALVVGGRLLFGSGAGGAARAPGTLAWLGRVARSAAQGAAINSGVAGLNAPTGQRLPAMRDALLPGAAFGGAGAAVGEGLAAARPVLQNAASRAYATVAGARYAPELRQASRMGLERFGEIARRLGLGRPAVPLSGGMAARAERVAGQAGAEVGQIGRRLPPVPLRRSVDRLQVRDARLARSGMAGQRETAVANIGEQVIPREMRERIAREIGEDASAAAGGAAPERPAVAEILQRARGERIPFSEAHRTRQNFDDAINWDRGNARGGAADEAVAARVGLSSDMQRVANQAGRGDAWRRANEEFQASTISHTGLDRLEQRRWGNSPLGMAGATGGTGLRTLFGVAASRFGHRAQLTVLDLLHAASRAGGPVQVLGVYGPAFQRMQQQHGDTGVAAEHYRRSTTDPAYSAATSEEE